MKEREKLALIDYEILPRRCPHCDLKVNANLDGFYKLCLEKCTKEGRCGGLPDSKQDERDIVSKSKKARQTAALAGANLNTKTIKKVVEIKPVDEFPDKDINLNPVMDEHTIWKKRGKRI